MLNIFSKRSVVIISTVMTLIMFMVVMFIVNPSIDGKDGIDVLSLQLAFDKKVGIEIINNWTQSGIENFNKLIKLPKCSAVIHPAAIASVVESIDNPSFVNDVNVNGTLNMLEFCRKKKIKKTRKRISSMMKI